MSALVTYRSISDRPQRIGEIAIYTVYGIGNEVLYVGQTNDIRRRLREHRRLASWWQYVAEVVYVLADTRAAALRHERWCIGVAAPIFNVRGRSA